MKTSNKNDIAEIFGYTPSDISKEVRLLWNLEACPFVNEKCTKFNHDQTIVYGTCSVSNKNADVIICPKRLYANNYDAIRKVSIDTFGDIPMYLFNEFIQNRGNVNKCVVALGQNSGKEVKVGKSGRSMSMDWVLALIEDSRLVEYVGIEVQSIDITGNYRDAWHGYKNITLNTQNVIPSSKHGMNWANVHKRLIPQLIRKGLVYSRSELVKKGLYFIVPDEVYKKFEDIIGEIPYVQTVSNKTITVHTYQLGQKVPSGQQRELVQVRKFSFLLEDFANRFITGPNLPTGQELDNSIRQILGTV